MGIKSRTFDVPSGGRAGTTTATAAPGQAGEKAIRVKLTDKERKRVEKLIREAKSLQEITRLEKELNEGKVPGAAVGGVVDEEESEDEGGDKMET